MGFSLEAAIIVPLVIGSWIGMTLAASPAYFLARQAARLEVLATGLNLQSQSIYQAEKLQTGTAWTIGLQTMPQGIIEIGGLIRDDCQMIGRLWPDGQETLPSGKGGGS